MIGCGDESKMIRNQREKDLTSKQEGSTAGDHKAPPTSSRSWSGLKNPRIVRVSRAFGGKDRHSKVSTVRGLRDRRVRLSVPTAIQLYDLQDRLGLNQPSKVVDWLLNAAQHEINKLPPLQFPPEGSIQFSQSHEPHPPQAPYHSLTSKSFGYTNEHGPRLMSSSSDRSNDKGLTTSFSQSTHWNANATHRSEPREDAKEPLREKGNSTIKGNGLVSAHVLSHEILQRPNHSSVSGFVGNTMPYASYYQWEAANAYLSQLGMQSSQSDQAPVMSIPSSRSLAIESQIVFCPPGFMPSMFPSFVATPMDFNSKQFDQMQMASSISQTSQSNLEINSLHLSSPSARPFQ